MNLIYTWFQVGVSSLDKLRVGPTFALPLCHDSAADSDTLMCGTERDTSRLKLGIEVSKH